MTQEIVSLNIRAHDTTRTLHGAPARRLYMYIYIYIYTWMPPPLRARLNSQGR